MGARRRRNGSSEELVIEGGKFFKSSRVKRCDIFKGIFFLISDNHFRLINVELSALGLSNVLAGNREHIFEICLRV